MNERSDSRASLRSRRASFDEIKAALQRTLPELVPNRRTWKGATVASTFLAVAAGVAVLFTLLGTPAPNPATLLGFLVLVALLILLGSLTAVVLPIVAWIIRQPSSGYVRAGTVALGLLVILFGTRAPGALLVPVLLMVFASLTGAGAATLWERDRRRRLERTRRVVAILGLVIGTIGSAAAVLWLADDGWPVGPGDATEVAEGGVQALDLPDPSRPGSYRVHTYTYGSGEDLHRPEFGTGADFITEPVDGSPFLKPTDGSTFSGGWSGLGGMVRTYYWGFDATQLPLNGRVWAPEGEGSFPLVLMVHGNHTAEDFSDTGFAYLGELLASRGMIAVSVDQNFLNTTSFDELGFARISQLKNENDARGWLLLEHLRQWRDWNNENKHPFYRRVDMERIALIGHSRGGEAVAVAAAFNRLPAYPDDARVPFSYHFNIRSVAAIAPSAGQYEPAGVGIPLENVSYFTLHGANDGDVYSFNGTTQYERVRFRGPGPWFKSYLYVYGANHGQFNTSWGRADASWPTSSLLNLENLMPAADQEKIARVYISAFLEATLRDQDSYRALFRDFRTGRAWLPDTRYVSGYGDAGDRLISGHDEDIDVESTTLPGGRAHGEGLTEWREQMVQLKEDPLESVAVYLGWNEDTKADSRYWVVLPDSGFVVSPDDALIFSLADGGSGTAQPLDLTVELTDRAGNVARLPLGWSMPLQPRITSPVYKVESLNRIAPSEIVFQSYTFPLKDFRQENPAFDPNALRTIAFVFDRSPSGVVVLDDLGLRRVDE